jgi:hypothetical protein
MFYTIITILCPWLLGNRIYIIRVCTQGMEPDSLILLENRRDQVKEETLLYVYLFINQITVYIIYIPVNEFVNWID